MRDGLSKIIIIAGIVLLSLLSPSTAFSQVSKTYDSTYIAAVSDSIQQYINKHPRKFKPDENRFHAIPLFGVNYNEENNFGVFVGAAGYYRNGMSTETPYSNTSIIAGASINKSFTGTISGQNYSKSGFFLINYRLKFYHYNRCFWGLGFENGNNEANKSTMLESAGNVNVDFFFRPNEKIKVGPFLGFDYYSADKFSKPELIEGFPLYFRSLKTGIYFEFDSRDKISSPSTGIMISYKQSIYPGIIFNNIPYYKSSIIADFFFPAWEGSVFAFDLFGEMNYGDSPWFEWVQLGGITRMRGYYEGRYRDRNMFSAQMEIRQRVYKNHSVAVFGGAGNIFHSFSQFDIKQTLPTYGAGYRFEFAGILLRIDVGFGSQGQYAISAGINQAF